MPSERDTDHHRTNSITSVHTSPVTSRRGLLAAFGTAAAVGTAGCLSDDPTGGDWPRAGFDRRNSGYAPAVEGPTGTLGVRWSATTPDGYNSSTPVVVDDRVYVGYANEVELGEDRFRVGIRVLDLRTGETLADRTLREYEAEGNRVVYRDSVVARDGTLYLQSADALHALGPDGDERWHAPLPGGPVNSIQASGHPLVLDGTVFAPTASTTRHGEASEGLYAVDTDTGDPMWRYAVPAGDGLRWTFSPATDGDTLYLAVYGLGVVALDPSSGTVRWRSDRPVSGPATVGGDTVFVPVGAGDRDGVAALDAATGDRRWFAGDSGSWLGRRVAVAEGMAYHRVIGTEGPALVARDAATGDLVWRRDDVSPHEGGPTVAGDAVYVVSGGSQDGIYAFDRDSGDARGSVSVSGATQSGAGVAVTDDLVVAHVRRNVVAVESCLIEVGGECRV